MIISIALEALTGKFVTDFQRASKETEKAAKEAQKHFDEFKEKAVRALEAVGVALTFDAFKEFVAHSIEAADQMGKMSQKTGIAVDQLSKLSYAAKLADVDSDSLVDSLVKLSKSAIDSTKGTGDAAAAFEALGVKVTDAQGHIKPVNDLLGDTAEAFSKFEDGPEKAAAAVAIFGKSGANLIPLLNGGKKAIQEAGDQLEKFGGILDKDTTEAANEFDDKLTALHEAAAGFGTQLAKGLLPGLNATADAFVHLAENSDIAKGAVQVFRTVAETIEVLLVNIGYVFDAVGTEVGVWAAQINALAHLDFAGLQEIHDDAQARAEDARKEVDELSKRILGLADADKKAGDAAAEAEKKKGKLNYRGDQTQERAKALQEAQKLAEAQSRAQIDAARATVENEKDIDDRYLRDGLFSYDAYSKAVQALDDNLVQTQIDNLEELKKTADEVTKARIDGEITVLETQRQGIDLKALDDRTQHAKDLALAFEDARAAAAAYLREFDIDTAHQLRDFGLSPSQRDRARALDDVEARRRQAQDALDEQLRNRKLTPTDHQSYTDLNNKTFDDELKRTGDRFDELQAKARDFSTGLKGAFIDLADSLGYVGSTLGGDLTDALSRAGDATAQLAAHSLLYGDSAGEAFKQVARTLIEDVVVGLIEAAAKTVILGAIQQASIASTTAASVAASATVASAQVSANTAITASAAPAAAATSLASFGANAAFAVAGILAVIGVSKLFQHGFREGGYTGSGAPGEPAGIVHRGEFVVRADATARHRGLLEAINSGELGVRGSALADPTGGVGGSSGGIELQVNNGGEPLDIRVRRIGSQVVLDMAPVLEGQMANSLLAGRTPLARAIAQKFNVQPGSVR